MSSARVPSGFSALVLAVSLFAASCHSGAGGPPPRADDAIEVEPGTSQITVPVTADVSALGPMLERGIPHELWSIDRKDQDCVPSRRVKLAFVKLKTPTIRCDIEARVTRGPVRFSGDGRDLVLTMPVTAVVQARDIGGVLKQETANARAVARARITLDVRPDWTLTGRVDITYEWIDSPHMDFLGRRIDLSEPAAKKLAPVIARLEKELPGELGKLRLRPQVERAWKAGFTTLSLNRRNPPVWMRVTPQQLYYGGYAMDDHRLDLKLGLAAQTETFIGDRPAPPQPTPLPPMKRLTGEVGKLAFQIPVIADYDELEPVLMKALVKRSQRPFVLAEGTSVMARFDKATIYGTTGGRIAVGITFSARGSAGLLGPANGTVWLTALPFNRPDSRMVEFRALVITGSTDMTGGDLVLELANAPGFSATIAEALGQNFERDYQELLGKIDHAIDDERTGDLRIRAKVTGTHTGAIRASGRGLYLPVRAEGTVDIAVAP